jgi:hypothetical protein
MAGSFLCSLKIDVIYYKFNGMFKNHINFKMTKKKKIPFNITLILYVTVGSKSIWQAHIFTGRVVFGAPIHLLNGSCLSIC